MGDRLSSGLTASLGIATFLSYAWFTLMPDNHSFMVGFPWVYLVELGFVTASLWAIAKIWWQQDHGLQWLGGGLDWVIACFLATLCLSLTSSDFTEITFTYNTINFAYIGLWYGLKRHFSQAQKPLLQTKLILAQGVLSWAFIVASLFLWITDTVLPERERLANLKALGISASFDLSELTLRNWATFGHPNYVAGFLLLALPLLMGLTITAPAKIRWFWGSGFVLGLGAFYGTNSRGGWLGLFMALITLLILLLYKSSLPKRWIGLGGCGGLTALLIWAIQSDRLRRTFTGLFTLGQQGGEFAYRWITAYTGWQMGLAKPLAGQGLGSTQLLYQEFRPHWAGQEAEVLFQLHSTPAQIWAELGCMGIAALGLGIFLLGKMWLKLLSPAIWQTLKTADQILVMGIGAAGVGYGAMAITDYQLDVIAITGFLVLYLALLSGLHDRYGGATERLKPSLQRVAIALVGLTLVASLLWLPPINEAYAYSQRAFQALEAEQFEPFLVNLNRAYDRTPWQPYYAYQMGWTLGELALWNEDQPDVQRELREQAILWFQKAIAVSPTDEFGQSNLGWLTLTDTPTAATKYFSRAVDLLPARRLALTGLGESWFKQGDRAKGIEAIALEFVRFPELATSPQWLDEKWRNDYPEILQRTDGILTELIQTTSPKNQSLQQWLHQNRGAIRWYVGNDQDALQDFQAADHAVGELLIALETTTPETWQQDLTAAQVNDLQSGIDTKQPWALAIAAWLNPDQAETFLDTAWQLSGQDPEPPILANLLETLQAAPTFRDWLRNQPPLRPHRVTRIGFNVTLRHLGGNNPTDFGSFFENIPVMSFLSNTFTSLRYAPELDLALEKYWQPLLDLTPQALPVFDNLLDSRVNPLPNARALMSEYPSL